MAIVIDGPVGDIPNVPRPKPTSLSSGERWFVVRSLSCQEARAQINLNRQGFSVFLPRMMRAVRHARRMLDVKRPIFPGYMFVALDMSKDRWRSINSTYGVASLIMRGELPLPVPVGVVEALLDLTDDAGLTRLDCRLREGQSVRVVAGPLANAVGILERLDANGRVRVLLDVMNGCVPALMSCAAVAPQGTRAIGSQ